MNRRTFFLNFVGIFFLGVNKVFGKKKKHQFLKIQKNYVSFIDDNGKLCMFHIYHNGTTFTSSLFFTQCILEFPERDYQLSGYIGAPCISIKSYKICDDIRTHRRLNYYAMSIALASTYEKFTLADKEHPYHRWIGRGKKIYFARKG